METDITRIGPACKPYEGLLEDYLAGHLDAASAQAAEAHLTAAWFAGAPSMRPAMALGSFSWPVLFWKVLLRRVPRSPGS